MNREFGDKTQSDKGPGDRKLDELLARLPREIEPERDLWPDLETRLGEQLADLPQALQEERPEGQVIQPRQWRFPGGAQRWAAVMAFGAIGLLGWQIMLNPDERGAASPAGTPQVASEESVLPDQSVQERIADPEAILRQAYESSKADQLASMTVLPGEVYGDWQRDLAVWDDAMGQVSLALEYYPQEPALLRQLEVLYQQQLDYLQQLNTAPRYY